VSNWEVAMQHGLLQVLTYGDVGQANWASVSEWMQTENGWNSQHLVGTSPIASRAVMLCRQMEAIHNSLHYSYQNFFQQKNKFSKRVFGSIDQSFSNQQYYLKEYAYFYLQKSTKSSVIVDCSIDILPADKNNVGDLLLFLNQQRSICFCQAEQITVDNLTLQLLNKRYHTAGLFRYRQIYICRQQGEIVGCSIVYR
jgi:hypothetical protein